MDDQAQYYEAKLQYEIDPWDLNEAPGRGDEVLLVDTRVTGGLRQKPHSWCSQHLKPGLVTIPRNPGDGLAPGTVNNILKQAGLKS